MGYTPSVDASHLLRVICHEGDERDLAGAQGGPGDNWRRSHGGRGGQGSGHLSAKTCDQRGHGKKSGNARPGAHRRTWTCWWLPAL